MPTSATTTYGQNQLVPMYEPAETCLISIALGASATYPKGAVLGETSTPGTGQLYANALIAAGAAPVGAGASSGSLDASSTFYLAYTYVNATGESALSAIATVTTSVAQGTIAVSAVTPLPTGVASVNWYFSASAGSTLLRKHSNNAGTAFNLTTYPPAGAVGPPTTGTATTVVTGSQTAKYIMAQDCVTDSSGNITVGSTTAGAAPYGVTYKTVAVYYRGTFLCSDLKLSSGNGKFDATAMTQMGGRLISGLAVTDATAVVHIP